MQSFDVQLNKANKALRIGLKPMLCHFKKLRHVHIRTIHAIMLFMFLFSESEEGARSKEGAKRGN